MHPANIVLVGLVGVVVVVVVVEKFVSINYINVRATLYL
tara:strand:- start:468 stop:584 length:117 start_codon:yes stop_codon:yes gene_type:complete